jgi:DNA (cytosine-5)-methyltransferase 1
VRASETKDAIRLRAVDLFCGAGGLSQGFRSVGYEVSFALDSDLDSCESYALNHPGTDVAHSSITDMSPRDVLERSGGDVDVVIGGPSCQGFSTARKDRWHDPHSERNELWIHMLDVVATLRPRAFLLENVPGLVYWKRGGFGATIIKEFGNLGFTVSEPRILLAADYGVPQRRRRLFIVGLLGDQEFRFPEQTHMGGWRRDSLELWEQRRREVGLLPHLSCWEAIGDLPLLEGSSGTSELSYPGRSPTPFIRGMRGSERKLRDHEAFVLSEKNRSLVKHVPRGGTWRDIPRHLLPDRFRGMRRTDSTNVFGRLDPSLPAYTITTHFGNPTAGCFIHPYEDRGLTVREGARLQSFPDRYRFAGTLKSRYRQVGNAVPPILAAVLADAIATQIGQGRNVVRVKPRIPKPAATHPPPPTTGGTRSRMRTQKRVDTRPEILLRAELDKLGLRYEVDSPMLPTLRRKCDVAFIEARVACFVDGCFWHGCPDHARPTKSNTRWWKDKIEANKRRDRDTDQKLRAAGWSVVRVWEHEDPVNAAVRIAALVGSELEDGLAVPI